MKQLITALILVATAATAQAKGDWAQSVAKDIHPEVKVQEIATETECLEISRQLKGQQIYWTGERDQYGTSPSFNGRLNSKGQYVMMHCSRKSGSYAFVAPKAVIDNLVGQQKQRQQANGQKIQDRVKNSGLL
jgi:hypothetical protein